MKRMSIAVCVMLLLAVAVIGKTTTKPKITAKAARATALAKAPGKIMGEELEREKGMLVWSFDIRTNAKTITEVWVDANSGKVVRTELETPAHEKAEQKKEAAEKKEAAKH
jgi:hypothetical protein